MKEIKADEKLVAFCGLYCGACKKYLQEKCPGCRENEKAAWCKVRKCCLENDFCSCADCNLFNNILDCKGFNNIFSKLFGLISNSERESCIRRIGEIGTKVYASEMANKGEMSARRKT